MLANGKVILMHTAHIRPATFGLLEKWASEFSLGLDRFQFTEMPLTCMRTMEGTIVEVPDEPVEGNPKYKSVPKELQKLLDAAYKNDILLIWFDPNFHEFDEFDVFWDEWDKDAG